MNKTEKRYYINLGKPFLTVHESYEELGSPYTEITKEEAMRIYGVADEMADEWRAWTN